MATSGHFKKKLRIDLKWGEMRSKWFSVIHNGRNRHFVKKNYQKIAYWSEMVRNAMERDFGYPKWPPAAILWKHIFFKLCIDLKSREMRSKVIFGHPDHPKWPPAGVILWKKLKLVIDLKWREMRSKVIFGHPKWLYVFGGRGRTRTFKFFFFFFLYIYIYIFLHT